MCFWLVGCFCLFLFLLGLLGCFLVCFIYLKKNKIGGVVVVVVVVVFLGVFVFVFWVGFFLRSS